MPSHLSDFSDSVSSSSSGHLCCSNCRQQSACVDDETCEGATELFMQEYDDEREHTTLPEKKQEHWHWKIKIT